MISFKFTNKIISLIPKGLIYLIALFYIEQIQASKRNIIDDVIEQNSLEGEVINEANMGDKSESYEHTAGAKIIVLNKITTKSSEFNFKIGEIKNIGSLSVELHKCVKTNDPFNTNNWMLLTIFDNESITRHPVFSGWVLTSSQSLSTLEHPVYEVIPRSCAEVK